MGIKLKLITNISVFIDMNLDKIINIASSIDDNTIFFIFDIKNPPSLINFRIIKKEDIPHINVSLH